MYELIDNQGVIETRNYKSKEEAREHLADYHSIDWDEDIDVDDVSLEYLLSYGDWTLKPII